jgi:ankyrin repeat protein
MNWIMETYFMRRTLLLAAILLASCSPHADQPFMRAAERGDIEQMQRFIRKGVDVNSTDRRGLYALDWAARAGQGPAIVLLIGSGAGADARDLRNGWTPLLHAIHKHQQKAVGALLAAGANPDVPSSDGMTPLIMAGGYGDTIAVRQLLKWGADPNLEGQHGVTPLAAAVSGSSDTDFFTLGKCQAETVRALLAAAHGPNLGSQASRRFALGIARTAGCREVLALVSPPAPSVQTSR